MELEGNKEREKSRGRQGRTERRTGERKEREGEDMEREQGKGEEKVGMKWGWRQGAAYTGTGVSLCRQRCPEPLNTHTGTLNLSSCWAQS